MTGKEKQLDAISLGIMWDRLISITDEIVSTLVRTSFSTIVREAYDLTAVVTDAEGHLLAQGRWSAPPFIGTAPLTMAHTMKKFPPESLKPGDVLATNDPWIGTGHMYDITVMNSQQAYSIVIKEGTLLMRQTLLNYCLNYLNIYIILQEVGIRHL